MTIDHLLERAMILIGRSEQAALHTSVALRNDQIDQFGHLQTLGRLVVYQRGLFQIAVCRLKESKQRSTRLDHDTRLLAAPFAAVIIRNFQAVGHRQVHQYTLKILRCVIEQNHFKGESVIGHILHIVAAYTQKEEFAALNLATFVSVIEVHLTPHQTANGKTR